MYQYYTLDECYKLRKELHIPWRYIEECVGIKRTSLGRYKKVVQDPDAIKRASILFTVAIRSYMESGVATKEERLLFENFESAKAEDKEWGSLEERMKEEKCKKCEYYRNPDYTRCHTCKEEKEGYK